MTSMKQRLGLASICQYLPAVDVLLIAAKEAK